MWSFLVVAPDELCRKGAQLLKVLEQVGIKHFLPVGPVEALDQTVLHGTPLLDEGQPDAIVFCPEFQFMGNELRAIVHAQTFGLATPLDQLVQFTDHVLRPDRGVHRDVQGLAAEVVDHVEGAHLGAVQKPVGHEIHAPSDVRTDGKAQWLLHSLRHASFGGPAQVEPGRGVEPVQPFVVHYPPILAQPRVHLPKTPTGLLGHPGVHVLDHLDVVLGLGHVTVYALAQPQQFADPPNTVLALRHKPVCHLSLLGGS